jgi:hypothetical protein
MGARTKERAHQLDCGCVLSFVLVQSKGAGDEKVKAESACGTAFCDGTYAGAWGAHQAPTQGRERVPIPCTGRSQKSMQAVYTNTEG